MRSSSSIRCRLAHGERIVLRPPPSSDLNTANEVFAGEVYRPPVRLRRPVRRIVDLGSNVGYTLLYWRRLFPEAKILAFEPHPRHQSQIEEHVRLNGMEDQVELHKVAAGIAEGTATLTDSESASALVAGSERTGFSVPVRDIYEVLRSESFDLMKMDIEGSEYPILDDPRFYDLRIPLVVLEWHRTADPRYGREWCEARMQAAGYEVRRGCEFAEFGLLWGVRTDAFAAGEVA
jgi:FkbM family methyltransferase